MSLRLALSCFVLSLLLAACGQPQCNASTCGDGCCDANGECQSSNGTACGLGGQLCQRCGLEQVCNLGVCFGGPAGGGSGSTCGAATCPGGCCDVNGACQIPNANACGIAGKACGKCANNGYCNSAGECATGAAGGGFGSTGGGVGAAGGGVGSSGGGVGTAGGGVGTSGGGIGSSGGGVGTLGGGVGSSGGGVGTSGGGTGSCSAGCRAPNGTCQSWALQSPAACGTNNAVCAPCPLTNSCVNGVCTPPTTPTCTAITLANFQFFGRASGGYPVYGGLINPSITGSAANTSTVVDFTQLAIGSNTTGARNFASDTELSFAAYEDYSYTTSTPARRYRATSGTFTIDGSVSVPLTRPLVGDFANVQFQETDSQGALISGGRCLTLQSFHVNVPAPQPAPSGWTCDPERYDDGECWCACGVTDVDCSSAETSVCNSGWTCHAGWYGDNSCDCGCSVADSDCATANASSCQYCDACLESLSPDAGVAGCTDVVVSSDNTQCMTP